MINDTHVANILRRIKEELRENRPVMAYTFVIDLERYLASTEIIIKTESKQ